MNSLNEEDELDYDKGIAYFWKSTDLEPHVKKAWPPYGQRSSENNQSLAFKL